MPDEAMWELQKGDHTSYHGGRWWATIWRECDVSSQGQKGLRADEDIIINAGCLQHKEGDVQCWCGVSVCGLDERKAIGVG